MIYNHEERLLKIILAPHISEKASYTMKKKNTIVLKILKNATKIEIAQSIKKIFGIKIESINTLVVKGKKKRHGKNIGYSKSWKKAYIKLKKGQNIDFFENKE